MTSLFYGLYRMLHEENAIPDSPDISNELCELIYKFTTFTGCYPKEKTKDDTFNPKRIRADISHIKKKVSIFGESHNSKISTNNVIFGTLYDAKYLPSKLGLRNTYK